jgi:hypothetical protein
LRLFAVACCRRAWRHLVDERSRNTVEMGERYADRLARAEELERADGEAMSALDEICTSKGYDIRGVLRKAPFSFQRGASAVIRWACAAAWTATEDAERAAWTAEGVANRKELAANCNLLRCIFGNPFRPDTINPASLTPTVLTLGSAAYQERYLPSGELDIAHLAILADALEEGGCQDADILAHLRSSGVHVRGCWALDLLLGKE